ncbi:TetR/AcrR family transcriptional regulator [Winogradskya consettensis]|uniref:TetR family transcriptional regulator n=1 Tax=Winogradskya consettensis TaxID=113560 RepID=A0A919SQW4_9ACTN|nr:TetR family transcriptional regulator [Actinoplanes consettensis]GIM75919.1 TetR family transcriptional regulator [Actinoplanes consettensis]
MAAKTKNTERREDALSRERIIAAAIEILDAGGENGLTVRALAAHFTTGLGAIYWHMSSKADIIAAATDAVLAGPAAAAPPDPGDAIRALALRVFDSIDDHPWAGAQLSRTASQPTTLKIFESIGLQVQALGVPAAAQFNTASALLSYILGVANQNAALAQSAEPGTNRTAVLEGVSAMWTDLDPTHFSFIRSIAPQLRDHDDRAQFLAGIDLLLAGIQASATS